MKSKKHSEKIPFFIVIIGFLMSAVAFYVYFSSDTDLEVIEKNGVFNSYQYIPRNRKSRPYLIVKIDNKKYNIPSFVHAAFDLENFRIDLKRGDSVVYHTNSEKELVQIQKGEKSYFDEEERETLDENNSFLALILGIVFSIFTIMLTIKYLKDCGFV
jgi:hypothetical protein